MFGVGGPRSRDSINLSTRGVALEATNSRCRGMGEWVMDGSPSSKDAEALRPAKDNIFWLMASMLFVMVQESRGTRGLKGF